PSTIKSNIESQVTSYQGSGISLWNMATIMTKCGKIEQSCIDKYNNSDSAFSSTMCEGDLNMSWKTFRQLYLEIKRNEIYARVNGMSPGSSDLMNLGYTPHFNNATNALTQSGLTFFNTANGSAQEEAAAKDAAAESYASNCSTYAKLWIQQLAPCNYNNNDLTNEILPKLIAVCIKGSDKNHPYGSSSVNPDSASISAFDSFEEVLNDYNSRHGITNSYTCSPELINAPKPYNQQVIYGNKPVWDRPDSCECTTINSLYAQYKSTGSAYTSFSAFLKKTRNTNMTDADLDKLRSLCNTTTACNFLAQPIYLPPALQCYSGDICITCEQADDHYKAFKLKYPSVTPTINEPDSIQRKKNELFALYMNNRLGFGKQAWQYLEFMDSCGKSGFSATCASWDSLLSNFKYAYANNKTPTSPVYDTHGCDSSVWKYPHTDQRWVPLSDLLYNGVFRPNPARTSFQDCIHFTDSICVDTTFTIETKVKQPRSGPTFTGYGSAYGFWMTMISDIEGASFNLHYVNPSDPFATMTISNLTYPGVSTVSFPLPTDFNNFRNLKIEVTNDKYRVYFDGQYVGQAPHLPIKKFKEFYFQPLANSFEADWLHISDNLGNLILKEEFNNCTSMAHFSGDACKQPCDSAFTTFYNARFGTQLTYSEIKNLHEDQCKNTCLNACVSCTSTPVTAVFPEKCITCDGLQKLVDEYFDTLVIRKSITAGSESAMIDFMLERLQRDSFNFNYQQVLGALQSCNNSWKKNVAYKYQGDGFLRYYPVGKEPGNSSKPNFTVEAWIYPKSQDSEIQYVVQGLSNNIWNEGWQAATNVGGYRIYLQNGKLYFHVMQGKNGSNAYNGGSAGINTTSALTLNKWHHIVVERVGNYANDFKIFVDGILQQKELAPYTYL
ncbi:MAG TPA: LamG-like jellyroll fold domain-containing protein, partial [Segetibacter sp.]